MLNIYYNARFTVSLPRPSPDVVERHLFPGEVAWRGKHLFNNKC